VSIFVGVRGFEKGIILELLFGLGLQKARLSQPPYIVIFTSDDCSSRIYYILTAYSGENSIDHEVDRFGILSFAEIYSVIPTIPYGDMCPRYLGFP
jgi:hypothetical protein